MNRNRRESRLTQWALIWIALSILIAAGIAWLMFSLVSKPAPTQEPVPTFTPVDQPIEVGVTPTVPETGPMSTESPTVEVTLESMPTLEPTATEEPKPETFGYGIQVHGAVGDPAYAASLVRRLGLGWVKQQIRWGDLEIEPGNINWAMIDGIINASNEQGVNVLVSVVTAPAWSRSGIEDPHGPPDDLNLFAAFLAKLIERYPGKIDAIEVWNEQNLRAEWHSSQGINAERYLDMLRLSYQTIKALDPSIMVISGALSPGGGFVAENGDVIAVDDFVYFQRMIELDFLNYSDCVGAHHNGYNIGPDVLAEEAPNTSQAATAQFRGPFDNVHHSWSFKTTLWGYHDMMQGQLPLCVTEFGWASSEGLGVVPTHYEFTGDNTEQEQATWITEAYGLLREWGIARLAVLWNLDYGPKGFGPEDNNVHYSILKLDGSPRPAFDALESMPKP